MSSETSFDSNERFDPTSSPTVLDLSRDLSAMFAAQPDFRARMLGLDAAPTSIASPVVAFDLTSPTEELSDEVMRADVIMLVGRLEEDRGRFTAHYKGLDTVGTLESHIQVNGFLAGDVPVMTGVKSETYDRGIHPVPESRRFVVYEADVEEGRVLNERTTIDPTSRGEIMVGMANGELYDLDSRIRLPLDVSRIDPTELAALHSAMHDTRIGVVAVDAAQSRTPYASGSLESFVITDPDPGYEHHSYLHDHLSSFKDEGRDRFAETMRETFVGRDSSELFGAIDALPGSPPFVVSSAPVKDDIRDLGTFAIVKIGLSTPKGAVEDVRPKSARATYDLIPGQDPILSNITVKADRFTEVDGAMVATHEITSTFRPGEKPDVDEKRKSSEVGLSAVGGRLYAFRDDIDRTSDLKRSVVVSEVVDGLDGTSVRDLLRTVTGKDRVHEWNAAVLGEIGAGPVRVGDLDPDRTVTDLGIVPSRLARIDEHVAAFRKREKHDVGLMGQAGRVVRSSSTPSEAKGPESGREGGLLQRMKSLLGSRSGR